MDELRILSPTAILGYGFPAESFNEGMKKNPHVIAVDAGSTDPGPYYLGAGYSFTDRSAVKRDMEFMLEAGIEKKIPVIVGTCGGCGANSHLDWNVSIVKEIAKEKKLSFKLAIINAEIEKETVLQKFSEGKITALEPAPDLTKEEIESSVRIVAQMGFEPFIEALKQGCDVILAGRAYDPAVFSSFAIMNGFDKGLSIHLGKILECAAIAAIPGSGSDCMLGTVGSDYFRVETLSPLRKCTTLSVAAHTLYEKTDPYHLPGPSGSLDLTETTFTQETENSVIVKGTKFVPTDGFFVKLEGVKSAGYRTVSFAASGDPIFISQIDQIVTDIKAKVKSNFEKQNFQDFYLDFKLYGKNGVMSMYKAVETDEPQELGIIIEAVGKTQEEANTICSFARSTMLHFGYPGRKSTAGNLAFPFSPSDMKVGETFTFSIYHLMEVSTPVEHFPITVETINEGELV